MVHTPSPPSTGPPYPPQTPSFSPPLPTVNPARPRVTTGPAGYSLYSPPPASEPLPPPSPPLFSFSPPPHHSLRAPPSMPDHVPTSARPSTPRWGRPYHPYYPYSPPTTHSNLPPKSPHPTSHVSPPLSEPPHQTETPSSSSITRPSAHHPTTSTPYKPYTSSRNHPYTYPRPPSRQKSTQHKHHSAAMSQQQHPYNGQPAQSPPLWSPNIFYQLGSVVWYAGSVWRCDQPHTSGSLAREVGHARQPITH